MPLIIIVIQPIVASGVNMQDISALPIIDTIINISACITVDSPRIRTAVARVDNLRPVIGYISENLGGRCVRRTITSSSSQSAYCHNLYFWSDSNNTLPISGLGGNRARDMSSVRPTISWVIVVVAKVPPVDVVYVSVLVIINSIVWDFVFVYPYVVD